MKNRKVLILSLLIVLGLWANCLAQEDLVITTYYPSPYGSYNDLRSNQMAIGSGYSNVTTYPLSNGVLIVQNNVGIGLTAPTQKLDVLGNFKITGEVNVTGNVTVSTGGVTPTLGCWKNDKKLGYCTPTVSKVGPDWVFSCSPCN